MDLLLTFFGGKKMKRSGVTALFFMGLIVSLVVCLPICNATSINYGTFTGSTVVYHNVTEDSVTDAVPLFGTPIISGDTLDFNPIFKSYSAGSGASDMTDGQLLATIIAKDGKYIDNVTFHEAGDYRLLGAGTSATFAMVINSLFINIYEVWNPITQATISINPIQFTADMTFNPSNGDYYLTVDTQVAIWTGTVTADLTAKLAASGWANHYATKVSINLDNTLLTQSEAGTSAYIAKKDFNGLGITSDTFNIPEPMTMAILGLGGLLLARKRK